MGTEMEFNKVTIMAAVMCFGLSACITATEPETEPVPASLAFLSKQEILATLPGTTVSGIASEDNKTPYVATFSAGGTSGTTSGTFGGEPFSATWSVEGNKWCEQWNGGGSCSFVKRESATQLRLYKSETEPFQNPMVLE